MKYYSRNIIVVDYQGQYNKKVFTGCTEYFKTNDLNYLEKQNKHKKIKFQEIKNKKLISKLRHLESNYLYKEIEYLEQEEINKRHKILQSKRYR